MKESFQKLIDLLNELHGPNGCSHDKQQTIQSWKYKIVEEAKEISEEISSGDIESLKEELGDFLWVALQLIHIGERDGLFKAKDVLNGVAAKIIRRHPHVFGNEIAKTPEEAAAIWNRVKGQEKLAKKNLKK